MVPARFLRANLATNFPNDKGLLNAHQFTLVLEAFRFCLGIVACIGITLYATLLLVETSSNLLSRFGIESGYAATYGGNHFAISVMFTYQIRC